MSGETSSRKLEHILMVTTSKVESAESTLLEYVRVIHNPLPELDLDDVDLSVEFCGGKRLRAPLMITGMTGGHPDVAWINSELASLAEEYGIAMGVGSQRAGIEDPRVAESFRAARKAAPGAVIVANLGAPQLSKGYGLREAREAVDMVEADALAIHLNPGQEAFQDEGDPYYRGVIERIAELVEGLGVPIIVKEVGTGLSREAVAQLRAVGVRCFDVAGLGGTNWIKVEVLRSKSKHGEPRRPAGPLADYWGNPTAIAVMEARDAAPDSFIIGSGGVRNGLDVARVIALGADMGGIALPVLRSLMSGGRDAARRLVEAIIYQVKASTYLAGGRSVYDLWRARVAVWGRLLEEASYRGLDVGYYLKVRRLEALTWRVRDWI